MKPVVNSVYEHINNGGVSFKITNEKGPTIEIEASHFGHTTNHIKLHVTKRSLLNLIDMLTQAVALEYTEDYCCASETHVRDKETGSFVNEEPNVSCGSKELNNE